MADPLSPDALTQALQAPKPQPEALNPDELAAALSPSSPAAASPTPAAPTPAPAAQAVTTPTGGLAEPIASPAPLQSSVLDSALAAHEQSDHGLSPLELKAFSWSPLVGLVANSIESVASHPVEAAKSALGIVKAEGSSLVGNIITGLSGAAKAIAPAEVADPNVAAMLTNKGTKEHPTAINPLELADVLPTAVNLLGNKGEQLGTKITNAWAETPEQLKQDREALGPVGDTVTHMAVSVAPYAVAAMLGAPEAALTRIGILSAVTGGGSQLQDALNHKATPEQQNVSLALGTAVGATYAIPVDAALSSAAKYFGGPQLIKALSSVVKGPVGRISATGAIAAAQGAFAQLASNLTARDFAGYDPTRSPTAGVIAASSGQAGMGAVIAAALELLVGGKVPIKTPIHTPVIDNSRDPITISYPTSPQSPVFHLDTDEGGLSLVDGEYEHALGTFNTASDALPFLNSLVNGGQHAPVPPFNFYARKSAQILEHPSLPEAGDVSIATLKKAAATIGGGEQKVINDVLARFRGRDSVDAQEFRLALESRLLDFGTTSFYTHSETLYTDTGFRALDIPDDVTPIVHIIRAPYKTTLGGQLLEEHYGKLFPDYYAHARGFYLDNIPHIIEVQSNIAFNRLQRAEGITPPAALKGSPEVQPILDTYNRNMTDAYAAGASSMLDIINQDKYAAKQVIRQALAIHAQKGDTVIRVAAPETVALSEGWIGRHLSEEQTKEFLTEGPKKFKSLKAQADAAGIPWNVYIESYVKATGDEMILEKDFSKVFSVYTKLQDWLKNNGAQEVYDSKGSRWWELPIKPEWGNSAQVNFDSVGLGMLMHDHIETQGAKAAKGGNGIIPPSSDTPGSNGSEPDRPLREDLDHFDTANKYTDAVYMLAYKNRNVPVIGQLIKRYIDNLSDWSRTNQAWKYLATNTIGIHNKLKATDQKILSLFTYELGTKSILDGKRYELGSPEVIKLVKKYNLTEAQIRVHQQAASDFDKALVAIEDSWDKRLQMLYLPDNVGHYNTAKLEMQKIMQPLHNVNYVPFSRFGKLAVSAIAKDTFVDENGRKWDAGSTVNMPVVEGLGAQLRQTSLYNKMKRQYAGQPIMVVKHLLTDTARSWQALPTQMREFIRDKLALTEQQQSAMTDMLAMLAPEKSFAKHFMETQAIPGHSLDFGRAYASYFQSFANSIARMQHADEFHNTMKQIYDSAISMKQQGQDNTTRMRIYESLNDHLDYVMNPTAEWRNFKSLAFLWYLNYLPRSAMIVSSQLPLFIWPRLAVLAGGKGLGDVKAAAQLARSYINMSRAHIEKLASKSMTDASAMYANPRLFEPDLGNVMQRLSSEGILNQALNSMLATSARGDILSRMMTKNPVMRGVQAFNAFGSFPLSAAEHMNRQSTAVAAYRILRTNMEAELGRKQSKFTPEDNEKLYQQTKQAVGETNFHFENWNKPRYMWGRKGSLFVFTHWFRQALFFQRHMPGRGRSLLMLALMTGGLGMPFAQNLEDIIDAFGNSPLGRSLLHTEPGKYIDVDSSIHEHLAHFLQRTGAANEVGMSPQTMTELMLHGALHQYALGPLMLLKYAGVPMPYMDMSSAISEGHLAPGTEFLKGLATHQYPSVEDKIFGAAEGASGVMGGLMKRLVSAVLQPKPNTFAEIEALSPRWINSSLKSIQTAYDGYFSNSMGRKISSFDARNPADMAALVAQGLMGLQPTKVTEGQEISWAQEESAKFYEGQRRMLIAAVAQAGIDKDPKEFKNAIDEVRRFNASAPKGVAILSQSLIEAIHNKYKQQALNISGAQGKGAEAAAARAVMPSFQAPSGLPLPPAGGP